MEKFQFVDIKNRRYIRGVDPDECPICHFSINPIEKCWSLISIDGMPHPIDGLEMIFQCPRKECKRLFIARYIRSETNVIAKTHVGLQGGFGTFNLQTTLPQTPKKPSFPSEITSISQNYSEIYTQSLAAESYGLNQIAGGGFRKALEFLIKDYCISTNKDKQTEIKSSWLGACIDRYIDSPQVKACAKRAAWLGNDEIHYERIWTDKDISHLKELITLTTNWIQNCILTAKYESEMPNGS